jgi:hypothetical protein
MPLTHISKSQFKWVKVGFENIIKKKTFTFTQRLISLVEGNTVLMVKRSKVVPAFN